jgi:MarR family transcriptional regulator, organic hydroperoxide resistance regulator
VKGYLMGQENDDRVSEVLALFFRCLYGIQRTAKRDWRELDLTSAQLKVLVMLSFEDTLTINQLAQILGVSQPTASHLVERLVQAELVERVEHATDRRVILARPTARGEALVRRLRQGRLDGLRDWLAQLDEPELASLQRGLEALIRVMPSTPSPHSGKAED